MKKEKGNKVKTACRQAWHEGAKKTKNSRFPLRALRAFVFSLFLLVLAWSGTAQATAIVLLCSTSWSVCATGGSTNGGAPAAGDTIDLKTFTLTLDGGTASTHTCASISTTSSGYIVLPAGVSTCNTTTLSAGTVTLITVAAQTFTATGTINGGVGAAGITISNASAIANLGTVTGGSGATAGVGCSMTAGSATIWSVNGGSKAASHGVNITGGTLSVFNATANASVNSSGIIITSGTPKVTVSETCTGGAATTAGLYVSSGTPTVTVAGAKGSDASAIGYGTYLMTGAITVSSGTAGTMGPACCCTSGTTTINGPIYPNVANNVPSALLGANDKYIFGPNCTVFGFKGASTAVTLYAGALVPASTDVWTGVATGGTTGSITTTASNMLTTLTIHGTAGTYTKVPVGQYIGTYGNSVAGTLTLPPSTKVQSGTVYGTGGTSNTGSLYIRRKE